MKKPLKAIIFDLDGVITDTAEYHFLAWGALAEELNIPFSKEFNEQLKGISRMESLEKILVHGRRATDFTEEEKHSLANKKNEHYRKLIDSITPNDILPGMNKFILEAQNTCIKLAIASASKNAVSVITSLGLKDQFDVIVDAKTIKNGKPHPEVFLTAANLLQVEPKHCIGIEDAAAGVEAIKRAGMIAIGIGAAKILSKADKVYNSTKEITLNEVMNWYTNSSCE